MPREEARRLSFYETLAQYYDEIFPFKDPQSSFLRDVLRQHSVHSVLDVGCATGNQTLAMASWGLDCLGLDLSQAMIDIARKKASELGQVPQTQTRAAEAQSHSSRQPGQARFMVGDMVRLDHVTGTYDALVCLGNTLVHLTSESLLRELLLQFRRKALYLLIQIVNYDRILDQQAWQLPEIRTPHLSFSRRYSLRSDGLLEFATEIKLAGDGRVLSDSTLLRPLRHDELRRLLTAAGWTDEASFGSYAGETWSPASPATIISAT